MTPPAAPAPGLACRVPDLGPVSVDSLLEGLLAAPDGPPFAPDRIALCGQVSALLLDHPAARRFPELVALAFWLRPAELSRLARAFAAQEDAQSVLCPRGLVLHLPPGNVDTLSVYSWALSLLVGNRNLVRLSSRPSPVTDAIVEVLGRALAQAPAGLRAGNALVGYEHQVEITTALSARVDARMVWGGDETVRTIRAVPLPPTAVELAFADRWSFAVLRTAAWQALDEAGRQGLAERFFNDAYWFDQLGCASPRLLAWVGDGGLPCGRELFTRVAAVARQRGYTPDVGTALAKVGFTFRAALDAPVTGVFRPDGAVTVLDLAHARNLSREHVGGGLFYQVQVQALLDLVPLVRRKDQTLAHFGFDADDLRGLARALGGRGVDRIVPVGQALSFHRLWDGWDLLQALSRRVAVVT